MTFAIVKDDEIVDHVQVETLEELAGWVRGRRQPKGSEVVMMDREAGPTVLAGAWS